MTEGLAMMGWGLVIGFWIRVVYETPSRAKAAEHIDFSRNIVSATKAIKRDRMLCGQGVSIVSSIRFSVGEEHYRLEIIEDQTA